MKTWQQEKDEAVERAHTETLERCREMRVPPQPVRDDRGERPAWRPKDTR